MSTSCPRCGAAVGPKDAFCGTCGAPRAKAAAGPQAPLPPVGAVNDSGEEIGTMAIIGAGLGLLALFGTLFVLATVVSDTNAEVRETKVLAGKVSVIGTAKVRDWSTSLFAMQVPADWANIATGQALDEKGGDLEGNYIHTWQGNREVPARGGACDDDVECLSIQIDQEGFRGKLDSPRQAALREQRRVKEETKGYLYRDLGPVTSLGGRWTWRWVYDQGGREHVNYFFATCADGKPNAVWTVRTSAPEGEYPYEEFSNALGSMTTADASEPASGDCARVLD